MNASGGMHRKFGRREPIVFKRSSISPRTAGRWPRAQRWPEPLRQALEHVMLAGEYLCVYNFSFPRPPGHWPRAQPRQPNVSCRPALAERCGESRGTLRAVAKSPADHGRRRPPPPSR
jgi:hypothetical protein